MAKKKIEVNEVLGGIDSIMSLIKSVDNTAEIIAESTYSNINEWIPSGNFILNACMSGDLFSAIPAGRIVTFAGPSGCGKSFLATNCCREAQNMGYIPIVLDSEGAYNADFVSRLGVDPQKMIIKQVSTILEASQFIANVLAKLQEQEDKTGRHDKIIFVLDSLGNLTTEKERDDTLKGDNKVDFNKAKDTKAMFRVNATPLAKLHVPMIVCNHTYQCCSAGTEILMSDNTYKNIENIKIGDYVLTLNGEEIVKNIMKYEVNKLCELEFEDGFKISCTLNHRFMVKKEDGTLIYKTADELTSEDNIVQI